jgi:hypothetical protein
MSNDEKIFWAVVEDAGMPKPRIFRSPRSGDCDEYKFVYRGWVLHFYVRYDDEKIMQEELKSEIATLKEVVDKEIEYREKLYTEAINGGRSKPEEIQ